MSSRYHIRGVLQVGVPLEHVELPATGGRAQFELQGLKTRQGYEVKISFPGSVSFVVLLLNSKAAALCSVASWFTRPKPGRQKGTLETCKGDTEETAVAVLCL